MLERSIDRAADLAFEVVNTTATHARRVAGIVSTALGLTARELSDLVWDYLDLASQLRWPD